MQQENHLYVSASGVESSVIYGKFRSNDLFHYEKTLLKDRYNAFLKTLHKLIYLKHWIIKKHLLGRRAIWNAVPPGALWPMWINGGWNVTHLSWMCLVVSQPQTTTMCILQIIPWVLRKNRGQMRAWLSYLTLAKIYWVPPLCQALW